MSSKGSRPAFSVIIPMFNERARIPATLKALEAQTFRDFEVICVDNGSRDGTLQLVRGIFGGSPGRRVVSCRLGRNSYISRMVGAKYSAGEVLAFLDADCRTDRNWLAKAHAYFSRRKCAAIAGEIRNERRMEGCLRDYDCYSIKKRRAYKSFRASGANAFYNRTVFFKVGGFDILSPSGSDIKLSHMVDIAGYKWSYAPDVIVYHDDCLRLEGFAQKEMFRGYWSTWNKQADRNAVKRSVPRFLAKTMLQLAKELDPLISRSPAAQRNRVISLVEALAWTCGRSNALKS